MRTRIAIAAAAAWLVCYAASASQIVFSDLVTGSNSDMPSFPASAKVSLSVSANINGTRFTNIWTVGDYFKEQVGTWRFLDAAHASPSFWNGITRNLLTGESIHITEKIEAGVLSTYSQWDFPPPDQPFPHFVDVDYLGFQLTSFDEGLDADGKRWCYVAGTGVVAMETPIPEPTGYALAIAAGIGFALRRARYS